MVFKQLIKFTYDLEMDEENGIGGEMIGIQTIDILSGDGRRWRGLQLINNFK